MSNGADDIQDTPLHGVSLAQYAAVNAAIAEGFRLEDVLAIERIDASAWSRADVKWRKRLEEAIAAKSVLLQRYQDELAAAEDWLTRRVTPLDADLAAWTAFIETYSAAPRRELVLSQCGLGVNDVARLTRLWRRRLNEDPSLATKITSLPRAGELPRVHAEPAELKRSRRGGAAKAAPAAHPAHAAPKEAKSAGSAPTDIDIFGLDRYAGLSAELEVFPGEAERVRLKYKVESEAHQRALDAQVQAYLAADPQREREYRTLRRRALDRAKEVAESTTADERKAAANPASPERPPGYVAHFEDAPRLISPPAALGLSSEPLPPRLIGAPFQSPPPAVSPAVAPPAPPPAPEKAVATQDVSAFFSNPSLPFAPGTSAPPQAASPAAAPAQPDKAPSKAPSNAGGTQDVSAFFAGPALPFADQSKPAPAKNAAGTQDVSDFLAGPALPFAQRESPEAMTALPFAQRESPEAKTALPFAQRESPEAKSSLTVEQYASLCAEIDFRPERSQETLARYRLSLPAKASLDAAWRDRFARDRALYASFSHAYTTYKSWLAGGGAAPPGGSPPAAAKPKLAVPQYASLEVDLAMDPARRAATLQRYGLSEADKAELDRAYRALFSSDRGARAAFDQATATYRAWLASNRRG